jgi:two-component system, cell cycle sensor histidine kinase and response regulator CckA
MSVPTPLKALILEDSASDAKLMLHELRRSGFAVDGERVQTESDYLARLTPELDVILCDFHLPGFDAQRALELLQARDLDVPFIVVSGAIGEDVAVEMMRRGAADYLFKDRLSRLGAAIGNALEKRRSAAALRESERRFRELAANIDGVFWITTPDFLTLLYLSPAFEHVWGLSAERVYEDPSLRFDLVLPDDRGAVFALMSRARAGETTQAEFRIRRPDGELRWLWIRGFPIRDEEGRVIRIVGLTLDVTERKRGEEQLAEARDAALESSRLKSAFLANMSHEIRTPLNVIDGYAQLLIGELGTQDQPAWKPMLDGIRSSTRRLIDSIEAVLDISKLETGSFIYNPKSVQPAKLIHRIVDEYRALAREKDLSFDVSVEEPEATLFVDEYCLTRTLRSVFDNAVKFTARGGVRIRLYREPAGSLAIDVEDTGVGIGESFLRRIFQIFSQEENGTTRHFEGNGLGLAVSQRLLALAGARITVVSEKTKGTRVTIHFASASEVEPSTSKEEEGRPVPHAG